MSTEIERAKLHLTADILNLNREVDIYKWLALAVPDYSTKPFNKRFETWLNKQSSERFGTETIDNWGMYGESKTYPSVNFSLTRDSYSETSELSIRYKGRTLRYNYDDKKNYIGENQETEKLFGLKSASDIVERSTAIVPVRHESIELMQPNLRHLPKLFAQRDALRMAIKDHNDKVSYSIAELVRVK